MEALFLSVLNMSLTASYVIAAVCVARLLLKKAPKAVSYALWGVAGFRLVVPFSFESVYSLLLFNAAPIPQDIAMQRLPRIDSGISSVDMAVNSVLPAPVMYESVNPLQIYLWLGRYLWFFGIFIMLMYSFASVLILEKQLKGARLTDNNIYEADNLKTPFVLGFFKPRIYIPTGLAEEEQSYIILHEQTHIRRKDHVIKIIAYFVLCIHWFNPFAWLAFLLMGADMELSCDERVLREMGGDIKKAYSSSLLSLATGRRILNGCPLAFGEGGVKARIKNVLNFKKPTRIAVIASVAVVAVFSVGFAANPLDLSPSAKLLQEYAGATDAQIKTIEQWLYGHGRITFEKVAVSDNPILEGMDINWKAFDLTDADGNTFVLILRKADNDFTALLDSEGKLICGMIDNGVTPALYGEDGYIFSERPGNEKHTQPIAPLPAAWFRAQLIGLDMASLDYASDDIVIFHGYFGLFVYDLRERSLVRSLDLVPIRCNFTQGDEACEVTVSEDGNTVQLRRYSDNDTMYVYSVSENTLYETAYSPMENPFNSFVLTETIDKPGMNDSFSARAAVFPNASESGEDEYGFLRAIVPSLEGMRYLRGDTEYPLFTEG